MGDHSRKQEGPAENSGVGGNDQRRRFDAAERGGSSQHKEFVLSGEGV